MLNQELFTLKPGDILHYDGPSPCRRVVGPRGGIKETVTRVKVTSVKTWKRNPFRIEVRWQYGMYTYGLIDSYGPDDTSVSRFFHKPEDCPIAQ